WLLENQAALAAAGVFVYVELGGSGEPSGRFSLQNMGLLPPSMNPDMRSALTRTVEEARVTMELASRMLSEAERLRSTGNPDDLARARGYTETALTYIGRARTSLGSVGEYI